MSPAPVALPQSPATTASTPSIPVSSSQSSTISLSSSSSAISANSPSTSSPAPHTPPPQASAIPASTSLVPSPTSSTSRSTHTGGLIALEVIMALLGAVAIAGVVFIIWRRRRQQGPREIARAQDPNRILPFLDNSHPASQITPFSPSTEMPRYSYAYPPGTNMRIAHRQSNGIWQFSNPDDPFAPTGIQDLDHIPSSPSSSQGRPLVRQSKHSEIKAVAADCPGYNGDDYDGYPDTGPPPAYVPSAKSEGCTIDSFHSVPQ